MGRHFCQCARAKKVHLNYQRGKFARMVCLNRRLGPISPWNRVGGSGGGGVFWGCGRMEGEGGSLCVGDSLWEVLCEGLKNLSHLSQAQSELL